MADVSADRFWVVSVEGVISDDTSVAVVEVVTIVMIVEGSIVETAVDISGVFVV